MRVQHRAALGACSCFQRTDAFFAPLNGKAGLFGRIKAKYIAQFDLINQINFKPIVIFLFTNILQARRKV
jgi:hypothetical protein